MANIPLLRAVLRHDALRSAWTQLLAVVYWPYTTSPVPYCYYKLVTNVIRAVKINVLSYLWYTWSDIPRLSANQYSGLEPPNLIIRFYKRC
jgi:hypothetical protein